jgi:hypothetical protein
LSRKKYLTISFGPALPANPAAAALGARKFAGTLDATANLDSIGPEANQ